MTAEVVQFPAVHDRTCRHANAIALGISEIMMIISRVTKDLYEQDLPDPLRTKLVLQLQRLAVQACAINLTVADHVAVPADFCERISAIIAKLESAKPHA